MRLAQLRATEILYRVTHHLRELRPRLAVQSSEAFVLRE